MDTPEEYEPQIERIRIEPPPLEAANPDKEDHEESGKELSGINCLPNEIFYIIFEELYYENMFRAAVVCRRWSEIANNVIKLRPFCFATSYMSATREYNFAFIPEFIKSCASVGFFFLTSCLPELDKNVTDAISELLPPNCKIIMLFTLVASLNKNLYRFSELHDYMVCALLREHRNVQIKTIIVHSSIQDSIPEETYTEYTQMIETASKNLDHESYMCLMLFDVKNTKLSWRMAEISKSTFDHNKRVSLCGGMVNQLRTNNETNPPNCIALLITGSIRTWSIVLEKETRLLAQEKLQKFKEQVKLQKHAVGFVFFSWDLLDVQDMELTIFRNLFPNIPLIGCDGCYQFGRDTATYEAKFLGVQNEHWIKIESVTIMILTYG